MKQEHNKNISIYNCVMNIIQNERVVLLVSIIGHTNLKSVSDLMLRENARELKQLKTFRCAVLH